ncbi:MAG: hypothetical protein Q9227_007499 [Pyrenula ochraceoflavens]
MSQIKTHSSFPSQASRRESRRPSRPSEEVLKRAEQVHVLQSIPTRDSIEPEFRPNPRLLSKENPPSRRWLQIQAHWWRSLMRFAMVLHDFSSPKPPKPSFIRTLLPPPRGSRVELQFYVPSDYKSQVRKGHHYPVVVNFHGGGFCLGTATDDRYWARMVLEETPAVFVSVGYRLAPEHPFPVAVDDCVESLLYLSAHAEDLGLDTSKVALTGFSAGGNLAFTTPLRYNYYTRKDQSTEDLSRFASTENLLKQFTGLNIVGIVAWYPLVDYTIPREEKRRTCPHPKKTLPRFFTNLFDASYLPPPTDHYSPYVSPAIASDEMLSQGLPNHVQIFICEQDMLLGEGKRFSQRLRDLGKNCRDILIPGVPHGWDKSPNPWRNQGAIDVLYRHACIKLRDHLSVERT